MNSQFFHNKKGTSHLVYVTVIWINNEPIFKAHFPVSIFINRDEGSKSNVASSNTWEGLLTILEQEGWYRAES